MQTKKVILRPNQKFSLIIMRMEGGMSDAKKMIDISTQTLSSWIEATTEPSRNSRKIIEKKIPEMKSSDWVKHHEDEIISTECLFLYYIINGCTIDQISKKLKVSVSAAERLIYGSRYVSEKTEERIWELTKQIWSCNEKV